MIYLGIDPDKGGALATLDEDGSLFVHDTPIFDAGKGDYDIAGILSLLRTYAGHKDAKAVIEASPPMPPRAEFGGGLANWWRGRSGAVWETALAAVEVPRERVSAQKWKNALGLKGAEHDALRAKACELFPGRADLFRLKKSHGRAAATLIAEYRRRLDRKEASHAR